MRQSSSIEKICVYGAGGVGGFFGGKIAHATAKGAAAAYKSYFIARGAHLAAIKSDGLKLITPEETIIGRPDLATDTIADLPDPDLILI